MTQPLSPLPRILVARLSPSHIPGKTKVLGVLRSEKEIRNIPSDESRIILLSNKGKIHKIFAKYPGSGPEFFPLLPVEDNAFRAPLYLTGLTTKYEPTSFPFPIRDLVSLIRATEATLRDTGVPLSSLPEDS